MRTFIIILIIASLLQTSFVPINLAFLLLISRVLVLPEKSNLYLAFAFGLLIGVLTSVNIGFYALLFLACTGLTFLIRKTPLAINLVSVGPIFFCFLLLVALSERLFLNQTINFTHLIIESVVSVMVFLGVSFWEGRYTPLPQAKLKI